MKHRIISFVVLCMVSAVSFAERADYGRDYSVEEHGDSLGGLYFFAFVVIGFIGFAIALKIRKAFSADDSEKSNGNRDEAQKSVNCMAGSGQSRATGKNVNPVNENLQKCKLCNGSGRILSEKATEIKEEIGKRERKLSEARKFAEQKDSEESRAKEEEWFELFGKYYEQYGERFKYDRNALKTISLDEEIEFLNTSETFRKDLAERLRDAIKDLPKCDSCDGKDKSCEKCRGCGQILDEDARRLYDSIAKIFLERRLFLLGTLTFKNKDFSLANEAAIASFLFKQEIDKLQEEFQEELGKFPICEECNGAGEITTNN